jgi:hypothetical protein
VTYLNSGDWVENLTALEYSNQEWKLFDYQKDMNKTILNLTFEKSFHKSELNYTNLLEELLTNN